MTSTASVQFLNAPSQYAPVSATPVSADGCTLTYADGSTALCGTSGVWNTSLGYGNDVVADAIADAARSASFLGMFRATNSYAERAAQALLGVTRWHYGKIMFATSGSAAVDASLKLARYAAVLKGERGRRLVVSIRGSYHGMTLAAMSVAGQDLGQQTLQVDQTGTRVIDRNDVEGFRRLIASVGNRIAAVILEPVLGTGTLPVSPGLISEILVGRARHGYLVIADEVATGFGRTGPMFASDMWPQAPDLLIASKALTNGTIAASAIFWSKELVDLQRLADTPLYHAETQAGTPIACAAMIATIDQYRELGALSQGKRTAARLDSWLMDLSSQLSGSKVEGLGCFRSLRMVDSEGNSLTPQQVMQLVESVRAAGATVYPGLSGVQFVPALTYDPVQLDRYFEITATALTRRAKIARLVA